jgi:Bacterial aa3 type cytochrome c oxidase subunit IV
MMAEAAHHGAEGGMDIADQKQTFSGFLTATVWIAAHIVMAVALLVVAFAMGQGWFAGLSAFAIIGVIAGLLFRMSGAWWAALVAQVVVLGIGGVIIPAIYSLVS